jgi:hypothetical protein
MAVMTCTGSLNSAPRRITFGLSSFDCIIASSVTLGFDYVVNRMRPSIEDIRHRDQSRPISAPALVHASCRNRK